MEVNKQKKGWERGDIFFLAGALVLFIVFWIRCSYGVALKSDEVAYLASLKKFLQGDAFFLQDWQPNVQLGNWFLYQIFRFVPDAVTVFGNLLFVRHIYVVFQLAVTIILYSMLRGQRGSVFAALCFFCAVPYNIFALSYNTISISFMTILLVYCYSRKRWKSYQLILCGLLLSVSVLSYPFVALVYIVYALACVINRIVKQKKDGLFCIRSLGFVTVGCMILGVLFLLSLAGKGSVSDYITNFRYILSDTEHQSGEGIFVKLIGFFWSVIRIYWSTTIPVGICGIVTVFFKRDGNRKWLFLATCVFALLGLVKFAYIYGSVYVNLMWVPVSVAGIESLLLLNDMERKKKYAVWLVGGLLFTLSVWLGTNTGILSTSAACVVPTTVSLLLIAECAEECMSGKPKSIVVWVMLCAQLFMAVHLRITYIWFDGAVTELRTKLEGGPCDGIMTTQEHAEEYRAYLDVLDACDLGREDTVLFLPIEGLAYLYVDSGSAAPYSGRFDFMADEVLRFYELHPEKNPNKIVILDGENGNIVNEQEKLLTDYFTEQGYSVQALTESCIMISAGDG